MLTNSQHTALELMIQFLESDKDVFILKGYAGTGKTYLIREILSYVFQKKGTGKRKLSQEQLSGVEDVERSVFLAASTGRAARLMSQKGLFAVTLHKLIYDFENFFYDEKNEEKSIWTFALKKNIDLPDTLYIVDEASMIGDKEDEQKHLVFGSGKLLSDFMKYVRDYWEYGDKKGRRKIIFIGDSAQLPPITDYFPPALSVEYLTDKFNVTCEEYTLTEIVRQKEGSKPLIAAMRLRGAIEKKTYNYFSIAEESKVYYSRLEAIKEYKPLDEKNILITYSNGGALEYNLLIREKGVGEKGIKKNGKLLNGERLIVVQNNYLYDIYNGQFVTVIKADAEVEREEVHLRGRDEVTVLTFRNAVIEYWNTNGLRQQVKLKLLDNLIWSSDGRLSAEESIALVIIAARKGGLERPKKPDRYLKRENEKLYELEMKKYKEELKEYYDVIRTSPYFSALQVKFGYAITCHKAQGGEWEKVYVDFAGFSSYMHEFFYRWAYTAITRASKELIAINPPEFYAWSSMASLLSERASKETEVDNNLKTKEIEPPEEIVGIIPRNIYRSVVRALEGSAIKISAIQSYSWRERYTFVFNGETVCVDFNYSSRGRIKKTFLGEVNKEMVERIKELVEPIVFVSTVEIYKGDSEFEFPEEFLQEFYSLLKKTLEEKGISIGEIKHGNYSETYILVRNEDFCEITFYYTAKKQFSKSPPQINKSSSHSFEKSCMQIIAEIVNSRAGNV